MENATKWFQLQNYVRVKTELCGPKFQMKYYIPINRFSQDLHQAVGKNGWIPSKVCGPLPVIDGVRTLANCLANK